MHYVEIEDNVSLCISPEGAASYYPDAVMNGLRENDIKREYKYKTKALTHRGNRAKWPCSAVQR